MGKNLREAAQLNAGAHGLAADGLAEEAVADFSLDLLRDERMGIGMISFSQSEEVVQQIMREPYVNACTDGLLGGKPHPRAYGTYPRILGRYVRELGTLTLEDAVRKLSGLAAQTFGLSEYGRICEGARANLVVFDTDRVLDLATFEDSKQYPTGIEYVIVEGTVTVGPSGMADLPGSGVAVKSSTAH